LQKQAMWPGDPSEVSVIKIARQWLYTREIISYKAYYLDSWIHSR